MAEETEDDEVEKFREFLDHVTPEDFEAGGTETGSDLTTETHDLGSKLQGAEPRHAGRLDPPVVDAVGRPHYRPSITPAVMIDACPSVDRSDITARRQRRRTA